MIGSMFGPIKIERTNLPKNRLGRQTRGSTLMFCSTRLMVSWRPFTPFQIVKGSITYHQPPKKLAYPASNEKSLPISKMAISKMVLQEVDNTVMRALTFYQMLQELSSWSRLGFDIIRPSMSSSKLWLSKVELF